VSTIEEIIRSISRELSPQLEERLRAELAGRDHEWLVDQIVRLTLDAHALQEIDRRSERDQKAAARAERLARVTQLDLDSATLLGFVERHNDVTRERLIADGLLRTDAPAKGTKLLGPEHRRSTGEVLLTRAKDVLFALLFGDETTNTRLERTGHELLTVAVPRFKAATLDFMRASTELVAAGTWQDPDNISNDERAENVLIEVQFGETPDELVGRGVVTCLTLINNLEINEQVLYARMVNVEETTLIR
jgi:hypothetical protein